MHVSTQKGRIGITLRRRKKTIATSQILAEWYQLPCKDQWEARSVGTNAISAGEKGENYPDKYFSPARRYRTCGD
jgi:hypothetical protein